MHQLSNYMHNSKTPRHTPQPHTRPDAKHDAHTVKRSPRARLGHVSRCFRPPAAKRRRATTSESPLSTLAASRTNGETDTTRSRRAEQAAAIRGARGQAGSSKGEEASVLELPSQALNLSVQLRPERPLSQEQFFNEYPLPFARQNAR